MKQSQLTDIYLVNSLGQVIRTYQWGQSKITLVHRHDNGRVEAVADPQVLTAEGISFEVVGQSTLSQLKNKPLALGKFGELRCAKDEDVVISTSIYGQSENPSHFKELLRKTALVHMLLLAFI